MEFVGDEPRVREQCFREAGHERAVPTHAARRQELAASTTTPCSGSSFPRRRESRAPPKH